MMPVMDGITCTQKIRLFEKERGLDPKPIIALTANPMPGHKNECKAAGCTDYARKPIDYPSLKALVSKYCIRVERGRGDVVVGIGDSIGLELKLSSSSERSQENDS
eukprot:TRINITY_DN4984_c0_g1_i1.p1 TRINITY_DN4984_c0_g1~~TRINITY_DN4984_c0_g1_i1.p1  ORF type:complete len:106 (+),score=21.19 TRINITY_DN4984_c0_g1_i1:26-343(+)